MSEPQVPAWDFDTCSLIARLAHHGQQDKGGAPYIHHPAYVAYKAVSLAKERGWSEEDIHVVRQVAWLHDVIEDSRFTAAMLQDLGCPMSVLGPVMILTKPDLIKITPESTKDDHDFNRRTLEKYYFRITQDPITHLVKEADIWHNSRPERLALLSNGDQARLTVKYTKACKALGLDREKVMG